ncbi:MAG TPA: DNA alkylation repair protein [Bacteroidia bacterium]|jgi:3-methyladenine DNA glycosylase AlkC
MAEALKDMFNKKFYSELAATFNKADKNFHPEKFIKDVSVNLEDLSLNQRMRNTSVVLKKHLSSDYSKALAVLLEVASEFKGGYRALLFPDFVGQYGHGHVSLSLDALKILTLYGSSEFAIREYLKRDLKGTLKVMTKWAEDKDYHVRRLSSEGSRPRLPWSFNIPEIMNNPQLTRPILETLKADKELYVKKSVANHLNDFSGTQTEWMLDLVRSWDKTNEDTAWIVKHASRTLIKKGHLGSLSVLDFERNAKVQLKNFKLESSKLKLGEELNFSFIIISEKKSKQKLVIDYAVHYAKKSGEQSRKVFKLKELQLNPLQNISISKRQLIRDFSTRKHYAGKHAVEILVNGKSYGLKEFFLAV